MKDFSDFVATLTDEKISAITQKINDQHITYKLPISQSDNTVFATALGSANFLMCLELLSAYHEWLHK